MKRMNPGRQFLRTCLTALVLVPAVLTAQSKLSITMVGNAAIRMTIDD
ncbi:MAG: hypothetical protein JST39_02285, partial [Bacteroidetes bacterium]|nr:hypothetical protein [Bacteroidota bacterium]